ncbi:MAG: nuclear transport factor 2 family protein [Verrucomicrobiota bacterium]
MDVFDSSSFAPAVDFGASAGNFIGVKQLDTSAVRWLEEFSQRVRDRNFEQAKRLFDPQVIAFGTVSGRMSGLEPLVRKQWRKVWPRTQHFRFDLRTARAARAGSLLVVCAAWKSRMADGGARRRGRATLVLRRSGRKWLAIHTHFSAHPQLNHDPVLHHPRASLHD